MRKEEKTTGILRKVARLLFGERSADSPPSLTPYSAEGRPDSAALSEHVKNTTDIHHSPKPHENNEAHANNGERRYISYPGENIIDLHRYRSERNQPEWDKSTNPARKEEPSFVAAIMQEHGQEPLTTTIMVPEESMYKKAGFFTERVNAERGLPQNRKFVPRQIQNSTAPSIRPPSGISR